MVHPAPTQKFRPPVWWPKLDSDRPVVHVTQGTVDNADLGRLLQPTIEALADEHVMVVATTGGRHVSELGFQRRPIRMSPNIFRMTFCCRRSTSW